ncbi:MAG: hypothetical protein ACE37H_06275 [Phycisphaeraceae bacterium]
MKLLASIVAWLLACVLAGWVVYRLVRRRPVVLSGRLSGRLGRRAIRVAAVVMVALGLSAALSDHATPPAQAQQPAEPSKGDGPANENQGHRAAPADASPAPLPETAKRQADPGPARTARFLEDYARHLTEFGANTGSAARFAHELLYYEYATREQRDPVRQQWIESLRKHYAELPGLLAVITDAIRQHSNHRAPPPGPAYSADDISKALDEVYTPDRLHPAINAYLWGKLMALPAATDDAQAEAFALALFRVHRNARTLHAMIRAERDTGVAGLFGALVNENARAWMSKAGPSKADIQRMHRLNALTLTQAKKLAAVVEKYRQDEDAGAWDREGAVLLSPAEGSAAIQLVRPDATAAMGTTQPTRITRLDLIRTGPQGGRVVSDWLGEIALPANATLRVIDLPGLLTEAQTTRVKQLVEDVKTNATRAWELRTRQWKTAEDRAPRESAEAGLLLLERHLPLVYPALREATNTPPIGDAWLNYAVSPRGVGEVYPSTIHDLAYAPDGTQGLRLITRLYDESVFLTAEGVVEPYGYAPKPLTLEPDEPGEDPERPRRPGNEVPRGF